MHTGSHCVERVTCHLCCMDALIPLASAANFLKDLKVKPGNLSDRHCEYTCFRKRNKRLIYFRHTLFHMYCLPFGLLSLDVIRL